MLITHADVEQSCKIVDVERGENFEFVRHLEIADPASIGSSGKVTINLVEEGLTPRGEIKTKTIEFDAIYPIRGGDSMPITLIHCYGRREK